MSKEFISYGAIVIAALAVTLMMVKPRNAFDFSRSIGWYLLIFSATYLIRPAGSQLLGDRWLYQYLRIGNFEDHWYLMAIAVPLALLFLGIGYAAAAPPRTRGRAGSGPPQAARVDERKVRWLVYGLIALGYLAAAVSLKTGTFTADVGNYAGSSAGVYEHNTAWFAQDDLLVSSASVLYFTLTGHLRGALLLAAPWVLGRTIYGHGRSYLIGYFFALMAVFLLKAKTRRGPAINRGQVVAISVAVIVILLLFPLMSSLRGLKAEFHMSAMSLSTDALKMTQMGADPQDLMQSYMGTNSAVAGFEPTLFHLLTDPRSEMGTQYLYYYFIKPIPRVLWPGKGTPFTWPEKLRGVEMDPALGFMGAAPGAVGMAYEEWGWLGIPFEFLLTGWMLRKWEEAVRRRPGSLHIVLGYAGLFSMLPEMSRDGMLYMIASFWLFQWGIPVVILWMMSGRPAPARASIVAAKAAPAST
jgi:hypothetical protein